MELVDSNEKLLSGPEIVTRAAYNTPDLKYPVEAVLLALASEFSSLGPISYRSEIPFLLGMWANARKSLRKWWGERLMLIQAGTLL